VGGNSTPIMRSVASKKNLMSLTTCKT
jgi:hypothetical protein